MNKQHRQHRLRAVVAPLALSAILAASSSSSAHAMEAPIQVSCKKDAADALWNAFELAYNGHGLAERQAVIGKAAAADPACVLARYYAAQWSLAPDAEKKMDEAAAAAAKLTEPEKALVALEEAGRKNDVAGMVKSAQALAAAAPKSWIGPLEVAIAQRNAGKLDESLAAAKKATELGPKLGLTWNQLAYANMFLKKNDDAAAALKKYVEVAPSEPNAHDTLADTLLALGKLDEAEAEYKKATDVSGGKFAVSYNGVAGVRLMKGDFDGARAAFAQWKQNEPDAQGKLDADTATAWSFVVQGKGDDAMKALDAFEKSAAAAKAVYAVPEAPIMRAEMLYELEKYADAQKALDAAAKVDASKTSAAFQQSLVLRRAALAVMISARTGKVAEAEKGLAAVDAAAKGDNLGFRDRAAVAHGEVLLAKKDAKGAVAAMSVCQEEHTYCRYRLAVAQDAAGDAKGAAATRELIAKPAFRDVMYVYARSRAVKK